MPSGEAAVPYAHVEALRFLAAVTAAGSILGALVAAVRRP